MRILPETSPGLVVGRNYLPPPARAYSGEAGAPRALIAKASWRRYRHLFTARELATAACWILGAAVFGVALGMMFYG